MKKPSRGDLRRWATDLFDQQLWCWGRDISRPEGNVLLDMGMCRYRSTEPKHGTLYKATLQGDAEVWLWGFGLLYREPGVGCVFLRRKGFDPLLVERPPEQPVHRAEDIGPLVRPAGESRAVARELVRGAATWIAGYEHWVAESLGIDYRRAVLEARDKESIVPATAMAASWERLAKKSFRLSIPQQFVGPWGKLLASLRFSYDMPIRSTAAWPGLRQSFSPREHHRSSGAKQWRRETRTRGLM